MRFLSVGPRICLQLPSDSTSRWTPLLFSYTFPTTWACSGLSPARARPWRANETCAARRMKKSRSRLFRARAVCEAYTSFPRGAHPRGAFYVIGISYHIMNRLSATGFALCDEQPGCPRSRFSPSITSPRWRALPPASAGCSFSNGTRKTNAAFSVACFSFVLII